MDYNGNSISENPFLKHDGANKRLFRRRPIIIRDTDTSKASCGLGFKMKNSSDTIEETNGTRSPNGDLEYGPGIVEKLRAKFSRMSGAQKVAAAAGLAESKSFQAQAKKFSSCDDLLSEEDSSLKQFHVTSQIQKPLVRRTSRSISDMMGYDEFEKAPVFQKSVDNETASINQQNESKSIVQLCRRFEKNGEQAAKMRFARDPMKLIAKVYPDQYQQPQTSPPPLPSSQTSLNQKLDIVQPQPVSPVKTSFSNQYNTSTNIYKNAAPPPPRPVEQSKTTNVLKVLNDAKNASVNEGSEPEFVQIARRLRRYQPELPDKHEESTETTIEKDSRAPDTSSRSSSIAKWSRRQPETPHLSDNAKIIRETCDISAVLPQDPHSARLSKQPIPSITTNGERTNVPIEASPPPEEPKPNKVDSPLYRRPIPDIGSSNRSNLANSVFKYENPPPKPTLNTTTNAWKPNVEPTKISMFGRKAEDIGSKSIITSQSTMLPNVVSITVKGPSSNRIYSNYEKTDDSSSDISGSSSVRNNISVNKPPTTYSPSYISTGYAKVSSLSSKYVEEKSKDQSSPVSNQLSGLLSPREKPYGDDVTILKSEASNKAAEDFESRITKPAIHEDQSEDGSSTDDDSQDGICSYDVTPLRPNSLTFTRLAGEDNVGGDGNVITRSLISLVAEEDLPEFLISLSEKPVNYIVVEEEEKPSTSSILRSRDVKKVERTKTSTRIRFCTERPLAYAYLDEVTATRSIQWENGEIVEYSYFKELEEQEYLQNDPSMVLLEIEKQLAESALSHSHPEPSFAENSRLESTLSSAY